MKDKLLESILSSSIEWELYKDEPSMTQQLVFIDNNNYIIDRIDITDEQYDYLKELK